VVTADRFTKGMTYTGSPENLSRDGFDIRRFSSVKPRLDWSGYLRERYGKASLSAGQAAAINALAA
jgi:hypothetical protein